MDGLTQIKSQKSKIYSLDHVSVMLFTMPLISLSNFYRSMAKVFLQKSLRHFTQDWPTNCDLRKAHGRFSQVKHCGSQHRVRFD